MVNQPVLKKPGAAKGRRYIGSEIVFNVILTLFVLLCIIPMIHVVAQSMSGRNAVLSGKVTLWPVDLDFSAYTSVLNDPTMIRSMGFSIVLTLGYTVLAMVATILLAYPLSRKYVPGRKWLMLLILIPMYFSGGTIPNYLWIKQMNLIDSPWALVWPCLTSTYNTIILRNFFESVPDSLEESAKLDGCNDWQVLFRIILPLSLPSLATIALFYAVSRWNGYADVRYYINSSKFYTLQMKLYQVVFASNSSEVTMAEGGKSFVLGDTIKSASIVFSTVPILLVYPFLQKYFVQGVMIGAVKE